MKTSTPPEAPNNTKPSVPGAKTQVNASKEDRLDAQPAPGAGDKLRRALWGFVWLAFYRPSPTVAHWWRRFLLRLFGARIGSEAHPYPSARIWAPWNLEMGPRSCLGPGANCYSAAQVTLEADAIVSQGAHLCAASHDFREPGFPLLTGLIVIGAGSWVAAEAFIGPGVEIGHSAVIGARSVVTRNVEPNSIVVGNPAMEIGKRNS